MLEPAYVDRDMWEKIVLNLLSNAFKFTLHGTIEVRLREVAGQVELSVRDTGIGIPPDAITKVFQRFHRVSGSHGRTHEGSGIGLALVHELVKLHGGAASVDSVLGEGSTFKVVIPLGRSHLLPEQVGAIRMRASTALGATPFVEEALRWLPGGESEQEHIRRDIDVDTRTDSAAAVRARIVLADDNSDMRAYVRRLLMSRHDVEAVSDGEAALAAIVRNKPDLVLSDIMMPRLDGMQLLAKLRGDPQSLKSEGGSARMTIEPGGVLWEITLPLPASARDQVISLGQEKQDGRPSEQQVTTQAPSQLAGRRFLVIEDEPLVALDISAGLEEAGAAVLASTGSVSEALDIIETKDVDAALLDGNLHGQPVDAIAAVLTRRKVPFIFVTGYARDGLPEAFRHVPVLSKPFSQKQLMEAAARLLKRPGSVIQPAAN